MFESDVLAVVAQLHALAARVATAVGADTSGVVADEALAELLAAGRQLDLATCRAVERTDRSGQFAADGAASSAAYLRRKVNERPQWAAKRVGVGRAICDRLPLTAKGWEAGRLGLEHAAVIDKVTSDLPDPAHVGQLDQILSEAAADGLNPTDLERLAEQARAQTVPDQAAEKAARQYRDQKLHASRTFGGMVRVDGWLDPEAGEFFTKALAAFTPKPPSAEQLLADPGRAEPIAFRRAQALLQLARHALAHAESCNGETPGRETMIIGVGLDVLANGIGTANLAGTGGGSTLTAAAARRKACDTKIIPAVLGSQSEILDFGRQTRVISPGLRAALVLRDGGCVFAGCDRPPSWCEGHHRQHYANGGRTCKENLDLLCTTHHHLVHEGGWRLTVGKDPGRTPYFHPPGGRTPLKGQRRPLIPTPRRT